MNKDATGVVIVKPLFESLPFIGSQYILIDAVYCCVVLLNPPAEVLNNIPFCVDEALYQNSMVKSFWNWASETTALDVVPVPLL